MHLRLRFKQQRNDATVQRIIQFNTKANAADALRAVTLLISAIAIQKKRSQ